MRNDHDVAVRENSAFFARSTTNKKVIKENAKKFDEVIKKHKAEMLEKRNSSPIFMCKNTYDK